MKRLIGEMNITNASTRFTTLGVVSLPLVSVSKALNFRRNNEAHSSNNPLASIFS